MKAAWQSEIHEIEKTLDTSLNKGLTQQEAAARKVKYGPNSLKEKKPVSLLVKFLEQFNDFIIWILIAAALVSGFLREWIDALAIIGIVILNALMGFIQEYRAEKSLAALKKLSSPNSKVFRDGQPKVIPSAEIVPGDIIELEAGDHVPADSRLFWVSSNFSTLEASLTGESTPVDKTQQALPEKEVPLAERANMVYLGTSVASGKARAVVISTGMSTELGKIAGMIQDIKQEDTPLQKKLEEFGKWIVYVCFVLVGMVFLLGLFRGGFNRDNLIAMFLTAVSLAVAAIPEGLPAVVTIALALGVQRMVKRNALIRKLPSVETLGCATVICSDKTGTLTKNEMTVQAVYSGNRLFKVSGIGYEPAGEFSSDGTKINPADFPDLKQMLLSAVLCNSAQLTKGEKGYRIFGDPTEASLLTAAAKAGIYKDRAEGEFQFIEEIPFDSVRKKMSVVRQAKDQKMRAFVKGAPDILLNDCSYIQDNGDIRQLTAADRERISKSNIDLANQAMRVLAVAFRPLDAQTKEYEAADIEKDLIFLGLAAMIDPPREEVRAAVNICKSAGIKTVMITGDHKNTAVAIAQDLGFFKGGSWALSGEELDRLSDAQLEKEIERIPVYARVSPEHKLRIVRAWRRRGEVVAMTGDGVNDAPAVKEADIGVAMGITGTDVTKEVSDMVITDDNFASIVAAVEEGRGIYDNIKKFIHYLLSCNAGEILVMFVSSLLGMPVPLLPIHILWVNLVTDGFPALALGVDPVEPKVMQRMPRKPNEPVVNRSRGIIMLVQGSFIAFCSLLAFCLVLYLEKEGLARARTAAFVVLSCSQLFHSFNCRSMTESLFKIGIFTNKKLILACLVSFFLQMAVVYMPFLQTVFKTEALGLFDWFLVIAISSFPLWAMELYKFFSRRKCQKGTC
ncbi:MAG: calcium-transporting P-type ATPase, PMR1-type [Candidatus Omnitrophica bacterium]|jgi:Ca2+-transporting ATPase|nr:calcium-transporting P-type ATPase, PMR1-type [Candidatus Omnitrophota bacterium]MDD5079406.1 calcium-transporting P-type ATPase, PMR1-type [Candidatus Omnitrophota bacterium]